MKKLINEPIDVIESFLKGTDDVLAGDFFKLLREGRREIGLCTGILRYYGTKGIELMRPKTYEYGNGKKPVFIIRRSESPMIPNTAWPVSSIQKMRSVPKKWRLQSKRGRFSSISLQARIRNCRLAALRTLDSAGDERHRVVRVCKRKNRRRLITFKYFLKKTLTFAVMLRFFYAMAADLRIGFRIY